MSLLSERDLLCVVHDYKHVAPLERKQSRCRTCKFNPPIVPCGEAPNKSLRHFMLRIGADDDRRAGSPNETNLDPPSSQIADADANRSLSARARIVR